MLLPRRDSCVVLLLIFAAACRGRSAATSPTTMTAETTLSLAGQVTASTSAAQPISGATVTIGDGPTLSFRLNRPTSTLPPVTFELTGTAIDDSGKPRSNAGVYLDFLASDVPGTYFSHANGLTDGAGFYRIGVSAVPGLMAHGMTAFACLRQEPDYAGDCQWIRATTHDVSQGFHPYRFRRMIAGESTRVTILPGDSVCLNNVQDSPGIEPDYVCRTVRIVTPGVGVITVEALALDGNGRPPLEVEVTNRGNARERLANPTSVDVTAGTELIANVEMLWGSTTVRSFEVKTTWVIQ